MCTYIVTILTRFCCVSLPDFISFNTKIKIPHRMSERHTSKIGILSKPLYLFKNSFQIMWYNLLDFH